MVIIDCKHTHGSSGLAAAGPLTLPQVMPPAPDEPKDMQPRIMELLSVLIEAVHSPLHLQDTHSRNYLKIPEAKVDCVGLAGTTVAWSAVVLLIELRLDDGKLVALLGQLMGRCWTPFRQQTWRRKAYALAITQGLVQGFVFTRVPPSVRLTLHESPAQPLSASPASAGVQLLARLQHAGCSWAMTIRQRLSH